jgi:hypothetical protein
MKFGRDFDLLAQVGRGSEQKPALTIAAYGDLSLRAGFALQGPCTHSAAIRAKAIPLGKAPASGGAEDLDAHGASVAVM